MHVDEAARPRIRSCADLATLDRWFDRSLNATTLSDMLDGLAHSVDVVKRQPGNGLYLCG